jgi:hypothetical protein
MALALGREALGQQARCIEVGRGVGLADLYCIVTHCTIELASLGNGVAMHWRPELPCSTGQNGIELKSQP